MDFVYDELPSGLQPQRDGFVRCSAQLGIVSVSFTLFPSSPGIVKPHRRTDGANPCQNRQGRFCEQHDGKNGIDDPSDKVDVPGNLALSVQSYVGLRCHSSASMRPVMRNDWLAGRLRLPDRRICRASLRCVRYRPSRCGLERPASYEWRTAHQFRSHFDRTSLYPSPASSSSPISGATTERVSF